MSQQSSHGPSTPQPPPPPTTPAVPVISSSPTAATTLPATQAPDNKPIDLMAVYAVERSDQQNSANLNAAVVSVALAYVVALTSFLSDTKNAGQLGAASLFTPFPVLSLNGYITLQVMAGTLRRAYLIRLEARVANNMPSLNKAYPSFVALYHALIMNSKNFPALMLTALTYWSPLVTSTLFTAYVVGPVASEISVSRATRIAALCIYALMILLNVIAVMLVQSRIRKNVSSLNALAEQRLDRMNATWP